MRTRLPIMVAALLLVSAGAKAQGTDGQQDVPKQAPASSAVESEFGAVNQIDFGVRGTSFGAGSDQARYQRFQDLRDGATLDVFRYSNNNNRYLLKLQADNVGYRDQRFSASYNDYGKVKASFEWNQIPLNYSYTTQSLYSASSSNPGLLLLGDGIQSGIQNKTMTLATAVAGAPGFDLQSDRKLLDFKLTYSARKDLDLNLTFKNTLRDGAQPYAAGFGFGAATDELALPLDQRTTELGSNLEWTNGRAYAKAGYEGSFFHNNIPSLTWDNPVRATDSPTAGPMQGRMALAPDTNSNTALVSAGVNKLPGRSSANAYISVGYLTDNAPLIPYTSNTTVTQVPLPRTTADLSARVTALNFSFTSRPTNQLWFSARYRQYGFDNTSSPFISPASVSYDTSVAGAVESDQLGYTRHTFDADASFSPIPFLGIRGGYTRENIDRTFRFVEKTTEDVGRLSADLTGMGYVTLRGVYEHSKRTGTPVDPGEILADGEQPGLTQYDIASRNRDRFSAILMVTPISMLSFNASVSTIKDDYPNNGAQAVNPAYEQVGLLSSKNNVYEGGVDFVPIDNKVIFGFSYGYEDNTARQGSRYAGHVTTGFPPTFFDPNADWWDASADKAHTANVSFDVLRVLPKVDVKLGYIYSNAESAYAYSGPYAVTAKAVPLPSVTNKTQRASVDGTYHLTRHVGLGLVYWYEKYSTNDFALGPQAGGLAIPASNPSIMMIGYNYLPYNANTFMGRFTYLW